MRKTQLFCRICRTENNLKYTTKELRELNKKQLLLAQSTQRGQANIRASKKLLLTTPTLGNICNICDERIQIFHRLDDGGHDSSSDVEIDVVHNINGSLPIRLVETLPNGELETTQRPETPVIVDDDDMLFNIFMQKFDQKTQMQREQINLSFPQQQQFANQFHSTYTPPQSTGGCSEGDESKVIEILTSRESTPAPVNPLPSITTKSNMVDTQGHRIVAIIELDDDESEDMQVKDVPIQKNACIPVKNCSNNLSYNENLEHRSDTLPPNKSSSSMHETCQTNVVEDDDEIVFYKVDNEKPAPLKKRKRKSYDEKELRLVASLNLVSSDSEPEDIAPKKVQLKNMQTPPVSELSTIVMKKSFSCNNCEQKFPDLESLSVHERIHQGVKCTLCTVGFQQVKRLIHHMRRKHREYNGVALSEKPRSGQDSCMTIRLRYMQHTTFYECQLCGRIDDVFREHKEHIIEKHPNESKSLKDPIMKQLKCPVCKAKCGSQYLSLCRHLISSHEYQEYKSHLRELVHVSAFGWNAARQQEVAKTAKIFQFTKRKTFFFECKICCRVVAGYLHHLRHVKDHQKCGNSENKVTAYKEILRLKPPSTVASSDSPTLEKSRKALKTIGICISKNPQKKDTVCKNLVSGTNLKNKTKQSGKIINMSNKIRKSKVNDGQQKASKIEKVKKSMEKTVQAKHCIDSSKNQSRNKLQLKNKCKPKAKEVEKLSDVVKLTKTKSKKESCKGDNKKFKGKSTKKDIELKPQVKKIKVKTSIRQIDLQKYKCKYCLKKLKGFRLYNLHMLQQHGEIEYIKCKQCNKVYASSSNFEEHVKQCQVFSVSKQKRKFLKQSQNLTEIYQPFVEKVPNRNDISSGYIEGNYLWLKELLNLKEPLKTNDFNLKFIDSPKTALLNTQCCYCLHLFVNDKQLIEHKEHHHYHNPDILIRYKPLKKP